MSSKKFLALAAFALMFSFAVGAQVFAKDGAAVDDNLPKHSGLDEVAKADRAFDDNLPKNSGLDDVTVVTGADAKHTGLDDLTPGGDNHPKHTGLDDAV